MADIASSRMQCYYTTCNRQIMSEMYDNRNSDHPTRAPDRSR